MKSATPKVLHAVAGRSLLGHVIEAASTLEPHHLVVVVGHGRDEVSAHVAEVAPWALTIVQEEQNGTGHAVRVALEDLAAKRHLDHRRAGRGADRRHAPADRAHARRHAAGARVDVGVRHRAHRPPVATRTGYGRVVREAGGSVAAIVEDKDAVRGPAPHRRDQLRDVRVRRRSPPRLASVGITTDNAQGEEYLTDVIGLLRADGDVVSASLCADADEILGVNDRVQLAQAAAIMRDRINESWMRQGVSILDPASTWLDVDVDLQPDVVIRPQVTMRGPTSVASGAVVGPGTTLVSCEVGSGAEVIHTWAELAVIGDDARVGPFTFLRPGTVLGSGTRAGAYVEIKNSTIGDGAKVPHLSYVGDADVGTGSNIGAATIVVNYDGVDKHRTVVGDHVRIGSDTMLVAPVTVGDGAYTAAGSVITDDVPAGAMAVGRARQRNIEGWVQRRRPGSPAAEAAARAGQDSASDHPSDSA